MKLLFAFMKILCVTIIAVKCAATSCLTALTRKTGSGVKMLNNLYMNWVHVTSFRLTCQQQWGITMRPVIHRNKSPDWFSEIQCSATLWLYTCMTDAIGIVTGMNHRMQWGITMRLVIHRNKSPDWFSETQCSVTLWLHTYVWPMQLVLSPVRITECSGGSPWDRWSTEINHRIDFLKLNAQPHYGYTHMYDRCN